MNFGEIFVPSLLNLQPSSFENKPIFICFSLCVWWLKNFLLTHLHIFSCSFTHSLHLIGSKLCSPVANNASPFDVLPQLAQLPRDPVFHRQKSFTRGIIVCEFFIVSLELVDWWPYSSHHFGSEGTIHLSHIFFVFLMTMGLQRPNASLD